MRPRIIREGSVGVLILLAMAVFGGGIIWLRDIKLGRQTYRVIVEFQTAQGLQEGTPVNYRGIPVGKVVELKAGSNQVDIQLEIFSTKLVIPRESTIEVNRSGLISEASIDITPSRNLPENLLRVSPLSQDCPSTIICHNSRLVGQSGNSFDLLIRSAARLTDAYSDPQLIAHLKSTLQKTELAAQGMAKLTQDLSGLSQILKTEIPQLSQSLKEELGGLNQAIGGTVNVLKVSVDNNFSKIANSVEQASNSINKVATTADESTQMLRDVAITSANSITGAANQINLTAQQVNDLISSNRVTLVGTLNNINQTTEELKNSVKSLGPIMSKIEEGQLINNLENLTANAAQTSAQLRDISTTLNTPSNLILLQQTLDSARATFQNVQKITSDLDEITGDPKVRDNIRRLINNLGGLFSATQELEKQTKITQELTLLENQVKGNKPLKNLDLFPPMMEWKISPNLGKFSALETTLNSPDRSKRVSPSP